MKPNHTQTIKDLAKRQAKDEDVMELARAVARKSKRGEWYDGEGGTNIYYWIAEGDYDGNETVESLAAEWDED